MSQSAAFDAGAIERAGWRQGAVLRPEMVSLAAEHAPRGVVPTPDDWLIVTSHDCDVVNPKLANEPRIELLRAVVMPSEAGTSHAKPDKQLVGGRSPRTLHLAVLDGDPQILLSISVHERWTVPRELLMAGAPARTLTAKERRLVAEWLAKRYVRAAFPSAFDARWRKKLGDWTKLLAKHAADIQGVYLRLSTLDELDDTGVYSLSLLIVAPAKSREAADWSATRQQLSRAIESFWEPFEPGIVVEETDVRATDEVFLADLDGYQRFDADWVSFADDTETIPLLADLRA